MVDILQGRAMQREEVKSSRAFCTPATPSSRKRLLRSRRAQPQIGHSHHGRLSHFSQSQSCHSLSRPAASLFSFGCSILSLFRDPPMNTSSRASGTSRTVCSRWGRALCRTCSRWCTQMLPGPLPTVATQKDGIYASGSGLRSITVFTSTQQLHL